MLNNGYLYPNKKEIKVDYDSVPLNDYPRPNLKRDSYICLNGAYDIEIKKDESFPNRYLQRAMVPYAVESPLSGVNHLLEPDEYIFYHRVIKIPEGFNRGKLILHFDGVDQKAKIYFERTLAYEHLGGYTPFEVVIPSTLPSSFNLTVVVQDVTDSSYHTRGKQVLNPTGWFYSSSSGIYKPVWIESVPEHYIRNVLFYPDYDKKKVDVLPLTDIDGDVKVVIEGKEHVIKANQRTSIPLISFNPWSADNPYLYDVSLSFFDDRVTSYFGVRKIEIREEEGFKRLFLNDRKIFLSGLLDQGYYYQGNLTPKSYDDYLFDIRKAKELGFNMLRVHIKIENPLFYYYADREGMILIQDFPCGGEEYEFKSVVLPRLLPCISDEKHLNKAKVGREDINGRKEFEEEVSQYLPYLNNYPSILIYTIFNEGWGEFEPNRIYHELKEKDSLHLYDTASGWYDADSDFHSIHTYSFPSMKRKDKKKRCFAISEMGGLGYKINSHSYFPGFFGHGKTKSKEVLKKKFIDLYLNKLLPQIKKNGLCLLVYTQLSDCETEYNGLYTFDREELKIDKETIVDINKKLYEELN